MTSAERTDKSSRTVGASAEMDNGKDPLTIADENSQRVDDRTRTGDFQIHNLAL
jgi:hypothetical protein